MYQQDDVYTFHIPEDGILFPDGIYCSVFTNSNIAAFTVFTDKFSAPGLSVYKVKHGLLC
jgi:hypothetical protein